MLIPGGCIKQVKAPELNLQVNNCVLQETVFTCEFCKTLKGTFFAEHLLETTF